MCKSGAKDREGPHQPAGPARTATETGRAPAVPGPNCIVILHSFLWWIESKQIVRKCGWGPILRRGRGGKILIRSAFPTVRAMAEKRPCV